MPYLLSRFGLVLLCLTMVPFRVATAQSALAFEPQKMVYVEDRELIVTNRSDDAVRVDSIMFSPSHTLVGWELRISVADTVYSEMHFSFGRYMPSGESDIPFPSGMIIAPDDRMVVHFSVYAPCIACKWEGVQVNEIDTLFIYTDEALTEPYEVVVDFTDFWVGVEPLPGVPEASIVAYPSPASSFSTLDVGFGEPLSVSVTAVDMLGRRRSLVVGDAVSGRHALRIEVGDWPPGMYVLRVQGHRGGRVVQTASTPIVVVR